MIGRPTDNAAIRYMFTSFLRGSLHMMNLTLQVTRTPLVAIRPGWGIDIWLYRLNLHLTDISDGPWTAIVRVWPSDMSITQVSFAETQVNFINWLNHYKEYVK